MTIKSLLITVGMLVLTACGDGGVQISSRFANTNDIQEGTQVYFHEQVVGEVSDVVSEDNGSRVAIVLMPDVIDQLSSNSAVVVNRLKEGAPLEIYNRDTADSQPLQRGQEIRGLDSMFQLGAWMVGDAIKIGAGSISQYVDSFQQYLQSEDFQQDKENVEIQINGATVSATQAIESMGKDLNKMIKELAASEDDIVAAVDELGNELAPVVEEFAKSGSKLAVELEKFAAGLEHTSEAEQESGQKLLDSLLAMLEKINASMEEGAKQGSIDQPPKQ